jgi:hypothetical protein
MANWLKRFLNMDEPTPRAGDGPYAPQPMPPVPPLGQASYAPGPRGSAAPTLLPQNPTPDFGPPVVGPNTPGYVPPPTRKAPGSYGPNEVLPVSEALRMFVRGALPPQGLAPFTRELRTVTAQVADFYVGWTKYIWGDLIPKAISEAKVERKVVNGGRRPITIERQAANGGDSLVTPTLDGE